MGLQRRLRVVLY